VFSTEGPKEQRKLSPGEERGARDLLERITAKPVKDEAIFKCIGYKTPLFNLI